jgi:tRNA (cmo5U34)-methyltransferase
LVAVTEWNFTIESYLTLMREAVPGYDRLEDETAKATGSGASSILELGTGTGETALRILDRHPDAELIGIDERSEMLDVARQNLRSDRVSLLLSRLEDPLPDGPYDVVVSALAVHHLAAASKADLFRRIAGVISPDGRFVLADVVEPVNPTYEVTAIDPEVDHPSTLDEQLVWLEQGGMQPQVTWSHRDLVVIAATKRVR